MIGRTTLADGTVTQPGYPFDTAGRALIDGFTCSGSKAGGGIYAAMGAGNLTISNNHVTGNQGNSAGGISIGTPTPISTWPMTTWSSATTKSPKTAAFRAPAASPSTSTRTTTSSSTTSSGATSPASTAAASASAACAWATTSSSSIRSCSTKTHFGALLAQAGDGGGIYIGGDAAGGAGTGNVTINANLIQGNMTGAGYGGGIRAFAVNGADVSSSPANPDNWYSLNIFNNLIVNNVAGLSGAGISLQDVAKARIVNNTVANNDCTATAALAFTAGQLNSTPQPAGIVGARHSDLLIALFDAVRARRSYTNPLLVNNIVWHNRSWYNDAALNGNQGGLAPRPGSPYWDLAILGSTSCGRSASVAPVLGPDVLDRSGHRL